MKDFKKYPSNNGLCKRITQLLVMTFTTFFLGVKGGDFNVFLYTGTDMNTINISPAFTNYPFCSGQYAINSSDQIRTIIVLSSNLPPFWEKSVLVTYISDFTNAIHDHLFFDVSITTHSCFSDNNQSNSNLLLTGLYCDSNVKSIFSFKYYEANIDRNQITITFNRYINTSFGISYLQLNVNSCHPSCLTCSGPGSNQCKTCSQLLIGTNVCRCTNTSDIFHLGICLPASTGCPSQYFLKLLNCQYIKRCSSYDSTLGLCTSCSVGLIWEGICVLTCPAGYSSILSGPCINENKLYMNVFTHYLKGVFNQEDFSEIEVNQQQFILATNSYFPMVSKCGIYQLIGGFLLNSHGNLITFPILIIRNNFIKITFRYIIIDLNISTNPLPYDTLISVKITSISFSSNIIIDNTTTPQQMCGQSNLEYVQVATFTVIVGATAISNISITIQIQNLNPLSQYSSSNSQNHAYFGIREVSVYGYDCWVSNCSTCLGNLCQQCITGFFIKIDDNTCSTCTLTGYRISGIECLVCQSHCISCNATECLQCDSGYYIDTQYCRLCDVSCLTCIGQADQCIQCSALYFQINPPSKICTKCIQTFETVSSQSCQVCQPYTILCKDLSIYFPYFNLSVSPYYLGSCCQVCNCQLCLTSFLINQGYCLSSCSDIGQNFVFDITSNQCICPRTLYHIINPDLSIQCLNYIPAGYFCAANNICQQCVPDCQLCLNSSMCQQCTQMTYLWMGNCHQNCYPSLNIVISDTQGICECKQGHVLMKRDVIEMKNGFSLQEFACFVPLVLLNFEIINVYSGMSTRTDIPQNLECNYFIFTFNRQILEVEYLTFSFLIEKSKMIYGRDYSIKNQLKKINTIVAEVYLEKSHFIEEITLYLIGSTKVFTFSKTVLVSRTYSKTHQSSLNKNTIGSMDSLSSSLTSESSFIYNLSYYSKQYQLLCKFSNFVQILSQMYLINNEGPPLIKYGSLLGASFLFTQIPSPQTLDISLQSSSQDQSSTSMDNMSQMANLDNPLCLKLLSFGISPDFFSNFIGMHILNIISFILLVLIYLGRVSNREFQYSIVFNNKFSNVFVQYLQGSITIIMFTITFTIQCGEITTMLIIYIIIYFSFHLNFIILVILRSKDYIYKNIPNVFEDINSKVEVAKSYFFISFLKKHIVTLLHILLFTYPLACAIIVSIIFFCNTIYILYFRFFLPAWFNIIKIIQELCIFILYAFYAFNIYNQQRLMRKTDVQDSELQFSSQLAIITLLLMLVCFLVSFLIWLIRIIFLLIELYQSRKKEDLEIETESKPRLNSSGNIEMPFNDQNDYQFFSSNKTKDIYVSTKIELEKLNA